MKPVLLTGPAIEPVSLAEAKAWMRVETSDDDQLISALVTAARLVIEASARLLLVQQSWRLVCDEWPSRKTLAIGLAPFRSLQAVRLRGLSDEEIIIAASTYVLDPSPRAARISFLSQPEAPVRPVAGIEIDVSVGFGDLAEDVPEPLRRAILMLALRWYERRGDEARDAMELPPDIAVLVAPFKRPRLA